MTEHTARDVAGWHVCLDVIEKVLKDEPVQNRKEEWDKVYPEYKKKLEA